MQARDASFDRGSDERVRAVGVLVARAQGTGSPISSARLAARHWRSASAWLPGAGVREGLLDRAEELARAALDETAATRHRR